MEHAANELAERYEEINLLYTITEILGRTVSLEEAAATILKEISETVGARRGSILVHDRVTDTLQTVAALGGVGARDSADRADDPKSVSARVFREQHAMVAEGNDDAVRGRAAYRRGTMLSVPIMWTLPHGGMEPLGVVNLSDRYSDQPFSAGDQKLIAAIATQIGTAIQNTRLVRASLSQQRLMQELALAHDLQMKLLPRTEIVAPEAQVAARVVPAESVGGDFYNLFQLRRRSHRRHDRRRVEPRLSRRAHHGAGDERVGHPRAGLARSGRGARVARGHAARGARDDGDVHHRLLRRDRPERAACCATRTPAIRTPSTSRSMARSSGFRPSIRRSDGGVGCRTRGRVRGSRRRICCCCSPTA